MTAPNVIFVDDLAVVNDCITKISLKQLPNFSEYIRKDTLIKWAEYQMSFEQGYSTGEAEHAYRSAMMDLIKKLNSM